MPALGIIHEVLHIPGGSYSIGDDAIPNASPKHQRRLENSVWLLANPVAWDLFEALVEAGGFPQPTGIKNGASNPNHSACSVDQTISELLEFSLELEHEPPWSQFNSRQLPLTELNWFAASAIADFLDSRLPTEIEWEITMQSLGKKRGMILQPCDVSGCLQEWTSDSFAPKYWRADFAKRGVPWKAGSGHEVTVRGSAPDELYKHICFRRGCDPASSHRRRGFRLAWDILPAGSIVVN